MQYKKIYNRNRCDQHEADDWAVHSNMTHDDMPPLYTKEGGSMKLSYSLSFSSSLSTASCFISSLQLMVAVPWLFLALQV